MAVGDAMQLASPGDWHDHGRAERPSGGWPWERAEEMAKKLEQELLG